MSLVPYLVSEPQEPLDMAPIAFAAVLVVAGMLFEQVNQDEEPVPAPAALPAPPTTDPVVIPPRKEKKPDSDPLDAEIFRILGTNKNPQTVRDIQRQLPGVEKSKINSRLYKLHCLHKVFKCDTKGAPLWFL